jgi:hypothetical protein
MTEQKSDVKELRKFAVTLFLVLGILGVAFVLRKSDIGFVLCGIASSILVMPWVWPTFLKIVYKYWMKLALGLGFISSHVILAIIYYLVFTPIGFIMRVLAKNPLALRLDKKASSYWIRREYGQYDKQRCEKMF